MCRVGAKANYEYTLGTGYGRFRFRNEVEIVCLKFSITFYFFL